MLLKLTIAYDGTGFAGWARQPAKRTVEGVLADTLGKLYASVGGLVVAGRTDAGVHAYANVVSVEVEGGAPPERAGRALNAMLPRDLAIVRVEQAPAGFHARHSAVARSYRYRIWRRQLRSPFEVNRSLWYPRPLDVQRLQASAAMLIGEHDFRAFTPAETEHRFFVCAVHDARWFDRGDTLEFEITARSFLRHMVRTLVGTMLERDPDHLIGLLQGSLRAEAGPTAVPYGLYLTGIDYAGGTPDERTRAGAP